MRYSPETTESGRHQFTCFVIGEGTLPIQCGEILLNRGHEICGIISPDAPINRWAEGRKIPHAEPTDDLKAFLRRRPFESGVEVQVRSSFPFLFPDSRQTLVTTHHAD